jgi:predicted adenylyl cyclase CyaB
MAHEVEMKVWVTDWDGLSEALRKRCSYEGTTRKEDRYFRRPDKDPRRHYGFRVRLDEGPPTVTYKIRSTEDGVERNVENEFHVDDAEAFIGMADRLGCTEYMSKVKYGEEYTCGEMTIGLYHLSEVGDFLEVETIVTDEGAVPAAVDAVRAFVREVGMESARVESRPYGELVRLAREGKLGS